MKYTYIEGYIDTDGVRHALTRGSDITDRKITKEYIWARHGYSVARTLPNHSYTVCVVINDNDYLYTWDNLVKTDPIFRTEGFRQIINQIRKNNSIAIGEMS